MSESPNKLIKFWQELKRRRVFSVVTTYAATAYIIIEVTNNLVEPLSLPAWIAKLVILLLGAGLPVIVILSWIFDFTPQGIKKTESLEELESKEIVTKPVKRKLRASYVLNAVLITAVIFLAYPKIFKRDTLQNLREKGKISVAVLPFRNMTNDTTWSIWQDAIQNELITSLTNSEELKVRQTGSINTLIQIKGLSNYALITPSVASEISQKLEANIFIYGGIKKVGNTIRLNAQLIDSKTEDLFKSFQIDGTSEDILNLINSLSVSIKNFLILSNLKKEVSPDIQYLASTNLPEAYKNFLYGQKAYSKFDYPTAIKFYLQSIAIDSNFTYPILQIFWAYNNQRLFKEAKKWCLKAFEKRDQMSIMEKAIVYSNYAFCFETIYDVIKYLRQTLEIDDQYPDGYESIGTYYTFLHEYDKAIPEYKKALEIYSKWGVRPFWSITYSGLGTSYHKTSQYKKEKAVYRKAEQDFPENPFILHHQARLAIAEGDTVKAKEYIRRYTSARKELSWSDARIVSDIANIYSEEGKLEKAAEFYQRAFSLEPENPVRINDFSYFLINKDQNINKGIELIDKVLASNPEDYNYLHTKGWGLYKKGEYQEALNILQKSWDLRQQQTTLMAYSHEAFLHLEAAKKTVASQKKN
jgi:adenylate cyclase